MDYLPLEIEESIVSFMDYKTLGRYTSVSKSQSVWFEKMEKEKIAFYIKKYRSIERIYDDLGNSCMGINYNHMVLINQRPVEEYKIYLQRFYGIIYENPFPLEMIKSQNMELKQRIKMASKSYDRAIKMFSGVVQICREKWE